MIGMRNLPNLKRNHNYLPYIFNQMRNNDIGYSNEDSPSSQMIIQVPQSFLNKYLREATLNMIFNVIYYLELCNAISIYCTSHFLTKTIKLIV
jgi:hypothetical protein